MDQSDSSGLVSASGPFYLMRATADCWKCGKPTKVAGVAATTVAADGEVYGGDASPPQPVALENISVMPRKLLDAIRSYQPNYVLRWSKAVGMEYYQNICSSCGVNFGDFYLFSEPEASFFPVTREDADRVEVFELPLIGTLQIVADWGQGGTDLIFERFGDSCGQK